MTDRVIRVLVPGPQGPMPVMSAVDLGAEGVSQSRGWADNQSNIQGAFDEFGSGGKGAKFLLPPCTDGFIDIGDPLYHYDNTLLQGSGGATRIRNIKSVEDYAGQGRIFDVGNRNKADMDTEPSYVIAPVAIGARSVILATSADQAAFEPGQIIWVQTQEKTGTTLRSVLEFNRIDPVAPFPGGGVIKMVYPFPRAVSGANPTISTSSGTQLLNGRPRRITFRTWVTDLYAETTAPRAWVTSAGGQFEGYMARMTWHARAGLYYNATARTVFHDVKSTFSDRWIEAADYSQDVAHVDCKGYHSPRDIPTEGEPLIGYNGGVRNIRTINGEIHADSCLEGALFNMGWGSDCIVDGLIAYVRSLTSNLIKWAPSYGDCRNNKFRNAEIYQNTAGYNIVVDPNPLSDTQDARIENVTFFGSQAHDDCVVLGRANTRTVIRNVTSEKGGYQIGQGTKGAEIIDLKAMTTRKMTRTDARTMTITAIIDNGSGAPRITLSSDHLLETGEKVETHYVTDVATDGYYIVTVITATVIDLVGATFSGSYTSGGTLRWEADTWKRGIVDVSGKDLLACRKTVPAAVVGSITTTSAKTYASILVPADTLIAGDEIIIEGSISTSGTNGTKTVNIKANGTTVMTMAVPSGTTGAANFRLKMAVVAETTSKYFTGVYHYGTVATSFRSVQAINTNAGTLKLDVAAAVTNASDTVFTDVVTFDVRRRGLNW